MQVGFFDVSVFSVYIGRDKRGDKLIEWRKSPTALEAWVGTYYIVACPGERAGTAMTGLKCSIAFVTGWLIESPLTLFAHGY